MFTFSPNFPTTPILKGLPDIYTGISSQVYIPWALLVPFHHVWSSSCLAYGPECHHWPFRSPRRPQGPSGPLVSSALFDPLPSSNDPTFVHFLDSTPNPGPPKEQEGTTFTLLSLGKFMLSFVPEQKFENTFSCLILVSSVKMRAAQSTCVSAIHPEDSSQSSDEGQESRERRPTDDRICSGGHF